MMDAGVSVPDDIAVIGVDNSLYARLSRPQLTVLDNKMQELSKAVAEVARNMTTYVPSPCETHWIPCSEQLPEMHEENDYTGRYEESNLVLICDASELHPQVHVGLCWKLEGRVGWRTREWKVLDKVTAWMPLPETYKEKNEDDE